MPKEVKNKEKKAKDKNKKHFLKDTKAELKKVIWPTSKQLVNNTIAVIVIVLIIGIIVFALDVCFEKMNSLGVNKLKSIVQSNTVESEVINDTESTENNEESGLETDTTSDTTDVVEGEDEQVSEDISGETDFNTSIDAE